MPRWPGRDRRVGPYFWRVETDRHRWSVRLHFWLHPANVLRLNRQPQFAEIMIGRCVVLCRSRMGPCALHHHPHTPPGASPWTGN